MIKLKKRTPTAWSGNGMGSSNATWTVVGYEQLTLWKGFNGWNVTDNEGNNIVRSEWSKKDAVERLEIYMARGAK